MVEIEPRKPTPRRMAPTPDRTPPLPLTPLQGSPAAQTVAFSIAAVLLFLTAGVGTDNGLAATDEWTVWRMVATFGCMLGLVAGSVGWKLLARSYIEADESFGRDRPAVSRSTRLATAAGFVLLVSIFLELVSSVEERRWDIPALRFRTGAVIVLLGASIVPWVALVWHVHFRAIEMRCLNQQYVTNGDAVDAKEMNRQHQLWMMLRYCVFAFAGFMVIALLQTGALRSLWQAQTTADPARADRFTSSDVLLYGGFLAVMMGCLVIPLLFAWKAQAELIVERHYPLADFRPIPSAEDHWLDNRERLCKFLHLDVSPLMNPLTIVSVFTPLIVSLLAVFLPELAP